MSGHYSVQEIKQYLNCPADASTETVEWCAEVMEHIGQCECCRQKQEELLQLEALQEEDIREGLLRMLPREEWLCRQRIAAKLRMEQGELCSEEDILAVLRGEDVPAVLRGEDVPAVLRGEDRETEKTKQNLTVKSTIRSED